MNIIRAMAMPVVGAALLILNLPAAAGTIDISYSFNGALTAPPVFNNGLLYLTATATGSVDQYNPLVNALWNPVTFDTADALDLSTGLDHGTFTWTFANGETLTGLMDEDDTQVDFSTNTGPFTQTLTFTGGTGEFAGVTGSGDGNGTIAPTGYTLSGRGTLTAPALVAVDEPDSFGLMVGVLMMAAALGFHRHVKRSISQA